MENFSLAVALKSEFCLKKQNNCFGRMEEEQCGSGGSFLNCLLSEVATPNPTF